MLTSSAGMRPLSVAERLLNSKLSITDSTQRTPLPDTYSIKNPIEAPASQLGCDTSSAMMLETSAEKRSS